MVKFTHASWAKGENGGGELGGGAKAEGTRCSVFASRCRAEKIADTLDLFARRC